jgi:hypothetical protein
MLVVGDMYVKRGGPLMSLDDGASRFALVQGAYTSALVQTVDDDVKVTMIVCSYRLERQCTYGAHAQREGFGILEISIRSTYFYTLVCPHSGFAGYYIRTVLLIIKKYRNCTEIVQGRIANPIRTQSRVLLLVVTAGDG